MEVFEALERLGFSRYDDIDIATLKQRYRRLSKLNHPDLGGDPNRFREISEAKEKIERYIKDIQIIKRLNMTSKERTAIISLKDLIDMYKGKSIKLKDGYILTASNLKANRVYVVIQYSITIDGIQFIKEQTLPYRIDDKYQLFCEISDIDIEVERDLRIMIHNKDIKCSIGKSTKVFNINIDNLVYISIQIQKIHKESEVQ